MTENKILSYIGLATKSGNVVSGEFSTEKALKEKDNTNGALYFMYRAGSDSSNVSWFDRELTKICEYGCHEFFR